MYSVVEIKGHQYKVNAGDLIDVQKLSEEAGSTVDFNDVLFVAGDNYIVGAPVIKGASVKAKVIHHDRDRKIRILKRRPRGWKRTKGHRQEYTCLLITEINDGNGNIIKIDASSKNAEKYLK